MKKADFVLIISIILLSISSFFAIYSQNSEGNSVTISKNGKILYTLPLSEETKVDLGGNIVCIEEGRAYMQSADCPDKLCIKTGKIKDSGRSIVCLPNKVEVKVTKKSDVDTVVR